MKIALIGLDGSGKSANIDIMKKDEDYKNFNFLWVRWQPSITVLLYKIKHRNDKVGIREDNADGRKKQTALNKEYQRKKGIKSKVFSNSIIRGIWFGYALRDYRKQFYKKTRDYIAQGKNVIFDRYYLDLFIDQGINFGYSPKKIYSEITKYNNQFPKMDKILYIRVSPEVCFKRKNDIPNMEYLSRRFAIYEYIAKQQRWIVINGEEPLEEVYFNIKRKIIGEEV